MANTVTFDMVWMVSGKQTIDLPDDIDPNDKEAVLSYLRFEWPNIPLPTEGDYIEGSDELDENTEIVINKYI